MIDTSVNRFGMILDSVQSDVMQVNKGTKELLLETDGIRQRLISEDASLQLMIKGLEDIKTNLDGVMKSISGQLSYSMCLDKLEQIFLLLSTLPTQIEASLFKLQNRLQNFFTKEIQAILGTGSLKTLKQNSSVAAAIPLKYTGSRDTSERKQQPLKNPAMPSKARVQSENKRKGVSCTQQERECRVAIESNEEINEGFSCFLGEKERVLTKQCTTINLSREAKQETDRILRRARRQKRKYCNPIIIN
ncbi:hypothetical protein SLA2020_334030 [Shorea laevis]